MNLGQMVKKIFQLATSKILEYVNKEIDGKEKKTQVDAAITSWVSDNITKLGAVQQFLVTQYIIPTVPVITQALYDCLKQRIEGLTV